MIHKISYDYGNGRDENNNLWRLYKVDWWIQIFKMPKGDVSEHLIDIEIGKTSKKSKTLKNIKAIVEIIIRMSNAY